MQPFSNIRVIDLTHVIAGPFCTYQLAVLGADVIKIEPPENPDTVRAKTAEFPAGGNSLGYSYTAQGSNKRAISVDLKHPRGKKILGQLLMDTDVLVENYRTGAMAKLGFGYAAVKSIKPDIIYCSLTGFGQHGQDGERTAYDNIIQAASGLMSTIGTKQTSPTKVGPPVLDYGTGMQAAFAIATALFQRTSTGKGQYIDIAMQDAALMLMSSHITYIKETGKPPALSGNMSAFNAGYGCYETSDGLIMLGAYTATQANRMWQVFGDPEHGEELQDLQPPGFASHLEEDSRRIAEILMNKTAHQWEKELNANRVPAARVRKLEETLKDRQLESRKVIQSLDINGRESSYPVAAFEFENGGPSLRFPPPVFAQHTREVLQDLGYNDGVIDDLASGGVVALPETGHA
jgi:crotonobetainyl-CoA:carnitine CoA-transferase CaiB-like acyl-CoA transferase